HNPHIRALYERLIARGKPKMAAIGAAMRKLAHLWSCTRASRIAQPST
ncbi:MAG TPA: IS110 family transposase, partial [Rhodocyclaceae bacterium]|nr:IS110 family transposase [Rhodocyclaceae bacterium]